MTPKKKAPTNKPGMDREVNRPNNTSHPTGNSLHSNHVKKGPFPTQRPPKFKYTREDLQRESKLYNFSPQIQQAIESLFLCWRASQKENSRVSADTLSQGRI
jgi:hypothetical protein